MMIWKRYKERRAWEERTEFLLGHAELQIAKGQLSRNLEQAVRGEKLPRGTAECYQEGGI